MIDIVLLVVRDDFLMGVILPAGVMCAVGLMILNQLLNSWGYYLW